MDSLDAGGGAEVKAELNGSHVDVFVVLKICLSLKQLECLIGKSNSANETGARQLLS